MKITDIPTAARLHARMIEAEEAARAISGPNLGTARLTLEGAADDGPAFTVFTHGEAGEILAQAFRAVSAYCRAVLIGMGATLEVPEITREEHMSRLLTDPRVFQGPIRVPSQVPGRWVYLRAWSAWGQEWQRSWGSTVGVVVTGQGAGRILSDGLDFGLGPFDVMASSSQEAAAQLDDHLRSLGAELVPAGEWPDGCYGDGGWPSDRLPFCPGDAPIVWSAPKAAKVPENQGESP